MSAEVEMQEVEVLRRQSFVDASSGETYSYDNETGVSSWLAKLIIGSSEKPGHMVNIQIPSGSMISFTIPFFANEGDVLMINDQSQVIEYNGIDVLKSDPKTKSSSTKKKGGRGKKNWAK